MAPGGGPSNRALPQVPRVLPQTAAVHLVVTGDPHHQDRVLLHCPGLCQRGMKARGDNMDQYLQRQQGTT